MSAGLDSAHAIASLPADLFVERFGQQVGGDFYARVIHESAVDMHDQTLVAYGNAIEFSRGVFPRVIGAPSSNAVAQVESTPSVFAAESANLSPSIRSMAAFADLFGRFDLCECEHCRSVYSPAAYFVDRILRGAKPADLPIEQPSHSELVITSRSPKALGLTIPPSLLGRADEVMQY